MWETETPFQEACYGAGGVTASQGLPQLLRITSAQITLGPEHHRVTSEASVCRPGYCAKDQDPQWMLDTAEMSGTLG